FRVGSRGPPPPKNRHDIRDLATICRPNVSFSFKPESYRDLLHGIFRLTVECHAVDHCLDRQASIEKVANLLADIGIVTPEAVQPRRIGVAASQCSRTAFAVSALSSPIRR